MFYGTPRTSRTVAAIALMISALDGHVAIAQSPVVRDSAGVRIVENGARAKAPVVFQLGATPTMDVGGLEDDPNVEFDHKQGYLRAARLSTGGLAVIDVTRVHFFDARGKRTKVVGTKGAGPREFAYLTSICSTRNDNVLLSDGNNARITVLSGKGEFLNSFPQAALGYPPFDACFDDETFITHQQVGTAGGSVKTSKISRVRFDGTAVNTIGEFTEPKLDMVTQSEVSVVPAGSKLYYGNPALSEIRVYSNTGKLLNIIRSSDPLLTISDADVERRMAGTIPRNATDEERKARMARMHSMPHAVTWPAYRRMHVDAAGTLWVQDYQITRPSPDGWTAFDATGKLIGRLVFPAPAADQRPLEIISFGKNDILVRRRDADGAAHLTVYPILRTTGAK